MKIGVLSDTHTKVDRAQEIVNFFVQNGVEFIVHAGDIGRVETLELLERSGIRYVAVYGNNDAHLAQYHNKYNLVQEPHYFKIANTKCKLMHLPYYMSPDTEIVLFGHTHEFAQEFTQAGTLFLNPGEACARNKALCECAILEITPQTFTITYASKAPKKEEFNRQKFVYQRVK